MSRLAAAIRPAPQGAAKNGKPRSFRPDIQGLRAIAVTMVVIYHLYPSRLPGGFAGVDVFFVISGYLITGHLWRGYRDTGRVSLVDFWGRRAKRLVPAAALTLAVTWVGSRLILPATALPDDARQILASALYYQNWQLSSDSVNYLMASATATPVQHFWSLSVEEQFYIVWPLLFLLAALIAITVTRAARRRRPSASRPAGRHRQAGPAPEAVAARTARVRRVAVAALTTALVAGSLAFSVIETAHNPASAYFVTTTRMWELGIGGLLALAPDRVSRLLGRQAWLAWAGLAAVVISAFVLSGTSAFPGYLALLPVGGSAALIAGGTAGGRLRTSRFMSARPMVFLGGISYSLYLWHFPIISLFTSWHGKPPGLVTGPALAAAAVIVAWLSKKYVEDPVRLASWLKGRSWRSVSTAGVAAVPVALVAVFIVTEPAPWNGQLPSAGYPGGAVLAAAIEHQPASAPRKPVLPPPAQAAEPDYWLKDGCLADEYSAKATPCVFGDTTHPTMTVALVGDSVAGNWWAPLVEIAKQEHWKLVTDLHGNCPFGPTPVAEPGTRNTPYPQCTQWAKTVMNSMLTKVHPQLVISSARPEPVPGESSLPQAYAQEGAGQAEYWKQLKAHGISVAGITETPNLTAVAPACVLQHGRSSPQCDTPAAKAIQSGLPSSTAAKLTGDPVINMNDLLCTKTDCPAVIGNVLVYCDSHHLTQQYAQTLAPYLKRRLLASGAVPTAPTRKS